MLLALFMIITSFPLNAFAAQTETNVRNEITDIRTVGDKQVINLGNVRGEKPQLRFLSRSVRFFGATPTQARSSSETVAQKVEINLETLGLNLGGNEFDPSALTEAGSFDVKITFKELGGRTETRTMTFQAGETKKTETFYLPKDFGNGNVEAEIPVLKDNIALRVYVGATGTTNFKLGQDMTYKFELTQIIHPVIGLKVVDPYGKELQENINQDLGLKLALEKEHEFNLPAKTKTFNIRTLADFAGDNVADLNDAGDNPTLSLTTTLDKNKRLKVGDKTYKLNKITYKALGQDVEINGQKKKVGGYIEFATQPKIIVPTPDDSGDLPKTPDGYKRLSFHAETSANANDGKFENGEKLKVIDVLEGTKYTDKELLESIAKVKNPTPLLNGRPDDNKKFLKWNPALPTDKTTGEVKDTDYYPVYLADGGEITPGEKLPDGVFEVKVVKDDTIAADPLYGKSYGVFTGSKLARDKFPDLEAAKGYKDPKWTTEAEDSATGMVDIAKPWTKVINKNTTFKATASKLPDIIENPTNPTPEGYVRVTFKAGEGVEDFKNAKTYDVKEGTALTQDKYPTAKAKVGYKDPKWNVEPGTAITSANATITATATKIENIVPGGPGVNKPEGYYTVEFLEGKHGEFKPIKEKPQVTVYYVNPEANVKMSQIKAPTVTAKVGYKFDSWSKEYQPEAIITGDRQITAVYIYVDGVSTEAKDGWTKVTLKSGKKGQFTKTTNVTEGKTRTEEFDDLVYYADPAREVTIPAPVVKATVGNTFTGFDKPLTGTFKEETTINAKYLSTSDVIEDKTPGDDTEKPEGYVTVKFDAGQNGTFAPNSVTKFFVNPEKKVEIGAPGIDPNKNFVFKGFFNGDEKHSSAKKMYEQDVTYTAQYEDKSNESIIPGDQSKPGGWVTISFSAGEHGTFELVKGKQPTIAYHVNPEKDVVLKDKAPAIKANDGYKFTKYDPDVETARKYTTEGQVITAQYKPTVVTENPNDKEHYAKVDFVAGNQGKFEKVGDKDQVTTFWVWKGEKVQFNAPKVTANENYKFKAWDPEIQEVYTDDKQHTAKYETKSNISDEPVEGFQEVKFTTDVKDGNFGIKAGTPISEKSVWVRPNTLVDLTDKQPTVTVINDKKAYKGWSQKLIAKFAKSEHATEIKALYKDIVVTDNPNDTDYAEINFLAGDHGTFEKQDEKTKFWVLKGTDVTDDFKAPKVTAKDGYKFDKWSPDVQKSYDKDQTHTATYKTSNSISDTPVEGFQEVKFLSGNDGKFEDVKTEKSLWVEPGVLVDLREKAPKVTANEGKVHTGWNKDLVAKFEKSDTATEITAQYKTDADNNGIADDQETTATPTVTARNIGKNPTKTTVEGKAPKGSTVTIKYPVDGRETTTTVIATPEGTYKLEIEPKLPVDTEVKVTAKDGEKKVSPEVKAQVFDDKDNDGKDDRKAGQTERPAAIASNIGKTPAFTTITGEAEKGATVTAKVGKEVVGTATADSTTGKYTIQAKQNEKPIKEGVKIDVTATLAPKTESLKQTVVVFKDTDGTGQPDSAKDFDVKKAKEMQVVASPDKMVYSDGDKLNLDGLKVLVTDVNGNQKIFTYKHTDNSEFTGAGLSVDYKQDVKLTNDDNGKKLTVTLDTKDNKEVTKAITGQTPTALTVNKNQSAQPRDVVAANQGDATVTKVKGKATKDAEIKITDANGNSLLPAVTTVKADANGDFTADLNKLLDPGTKVFVTATEPGKSESPKAETTVIRDKDGNWNPDTGSKLSTPVIDPIRENDEKVVVAAPKAGDKIQTIEVSDQNGNTVRLTKDPADKTGKTWTVEGSDPAEKVTEKDGKIEIPVKDKLPLNDRDQIKVTFKDGEKPANEAFDKAPVQKASQTPDVDPVYTGDTSVKIADPTKVDPTAKTIKVKVGNNDIRTIQKQDNGTWKDTSNPNAKIEVKDGKVVVDLDPVAKKDDVIKVSTINDSKKESPAAIVTVVDKEKSTTPKVNPVATNDTKITGKAGPNADVVITITPKNGGEAKEIVTKADKDGNFTVPADGLKDGDTIVAKATEKDKAPAESDPVTVGVDKSKLIKAIDDGDKKLEGKDPKDYTPADKKLKEAIEEGNKVKDNPNASQNDVNEKTKAIEDAIKEKEETDKALDELKKAKKALDKTIKEAEADKKPQGEIRKGMNSSKEAGTVIDKKGRDADGKDMTSEQIKDLVEKIKEADRILKLPVIQVTIDTAVDNGNTVVFTTNPGRCKVIVNILRNDLSQESFETETGPGGTGSILLTNPLKAGDSVTVKATRITEDRPVPDYLDNSTSTEI